MKFKEYQFIREQERQGFKKINVECPNCGNEYIFRSKESIYDAFKKLHKCASCEWSKVL